MLKSSRDILDEIDATLDQLIENADALRHLVISEETEQEALAIQMLQESLLAHLMHMDALLEKEKKIKVTQKRNPFDQLEKKLLHFGELQQKLLSKITKRKISKKAERTKSAKKPSSKSRRRSRLLSLKS